MIHYFDWTATSKPCEAAVNVANKLMTEEWGNPSSSHSFGTSAEHLLSSARRDLLWGFGFGRAVGGRVIFTSGGTEADNLAILGSAYAKAKRGSVMITDSEHPAVDECAEKLEEEGFRVFRVPTVNGELDLDYIRAHAEGVSVASLMLVNNETGAVYDIAAASKIIRSASPKAFIHTDAVQGFMKVRFTPDMLGVNAISVSAHKIGGLKGVGALYIDDVSIKEKKLIPCQLGGGQENSYRSGTENTVGICAFAAAVKDCVQNYAERSEKTAKLRQIFESELDGSPLVVNKAKNGQTVAEIASVTVPNVKSETVLNFASQHGYCISAGSACASRGKKMSRALRGFGISSAEADSTVRVSLSHLNTEEEVRELAGLLLSASTDLAKIRK